MSWMSQLYKTYEERVGESTSTGMPMTPIAHMNANMQLEVTLSMEGDFLGAVSVEKADAATLIPVTESSAGRTSSPVPHPLCDTLPYIAGDFKDYHKKDTAKDKNIGSRSDDYIEGLRKWAESEYTHPKVLAIYRYLSKKVLISDLIKAGYIGLNEDHTFDNKKISGQAYEKVFVRFRVLDPQAGERKTGSGTWEDASLIRAYTAYYLAKQQGVTDICYFMGQEKTIATMHPKGIVAADYGAKLVSANDSAGYTYRGRFQQASQAYAFSYEASQKIHSALTWLAKEQGVSVGTKDKRMFLCWNPEGKKVPDIFDEFDVGMDEDEEAPEISYRKKLVNIFMGYQEQFEAADTVVVMALDAATTGRLSVTYYQELMASDLLERIVHWGKTCNWFYLKFNEKKQPYHAVETPAFRRIAECAFGREKGSFIEVDDRILKEQTQRLVKCMVEDQPVPFDMIQALMLRASTPLSYSRGNRERVLSTACAMIAKYHDKSDIKEKTEEKGVREVMRLDPENRDRSYLFGRLLAVCEKIERSTYDRGETREPNAIRLQSAYVNHPMQTWKILDGSLNPYFQKLSPGSREYYKKQISDILETFSEEDEQKLNQSLKETYLLGYYLQRAELNKKKEEKEDE